MRCYNIVMQIAYGRAYHIFRDYLSSASHVLGLAMAEHDVLQVAPPEIIYGRAHTHGCDLPILESVAYSNMRLFSASA